MEVIFTLEEKVKTLIACIKKLKEEIHVLQPENDSLKIEIQELKAENAKLAENNAHFIMQLRAVENSILLETDHVNELKEERSVTRSALDDLIKSIDSIVENENQ
jgi:FtsZ-binding cell division protein ZapB